MCLLYVCLRVWCMCVGVLRRRVRQARPTSPLIREIGGQKSVEPGLNPLEAGAAAGAENRYVADYGIVAAAGVGRSQTEDRLTAVNLRRSVPKKLSADADGPISWSMRRSDRIWPIERTILGKHCAAVAEWRNRPTPISHRLPIANDTASCLPSATGGPTTPLIRKTTGRQLARQMSARGGGGVSCLRPRKADSISPPRPPASAFADQLRMRALI